MKIEAAPNWVPEKKRKSYDLVIKRVKEYSKILKSEYVITKITEKDNKLIIDVERHSLKTQIILKGYGKIRFKKTDDNKMIFESVEEDSNEWQWLGVGFLGGGLVTAIIIIILIGAI